MQSNGPTVSISLVDWIPIKFSRPSKYGGRWFTLKTASVLYQLETELGEEVMARVMRAYFQRWQFRHPDTRDFIEVAEEVSGRQLDWFFDQLLFGAGTLDYAVTQASSARLGFEAGVFDTPEGRITRERAAMQERREEAEESEDDRGPYRTTVVIENHGTIQYPVDVLVRFTDESEAWGRDELSMA